MARYICCKYFTETIRNSVYVKLAIKVIKVVKSMIGRKITVTGLDSEWYNIRFLQTSFCLIRYPYRLYNILNEDGFKPPTMYSYLISLLGSHLTLRINIHMRYRIK